jgi:hypothetical protein
MKKNLESKLVPYFAKSIPIVICNFVSFSAPNRFLKCCRRFECVHRVPLLTHSIAADKCDGRGYVVIIIEHVREFWGK